MRSIVLLLVLTCSLLKAGDSAPTAVMRFVNTTSDKSVWLPDFGPAVEPATTWETEAEVGYGGIWSVGDDDCNGGLWAVQGGGTNIYTIVDEGYCVNINWSFDATVVPSMTDGESWLYGFGTMAGFFGFALALKSVKKISYSPSIPLDE